MNAPRVLVVGAGIMGAAVAYHLARTGAAVRIVERHRPAAGTTGTSFARICAFEKRPRAYFQLNLAGMREHARLAARLSPAPWHHPCGTLIWTDEHRSDDLVRRAERLREWGYSIEWQDAAEVRRRLNIHVPAAAGVLLHATDEGWVDAVALTQRLLTEARRLGARLTCGVRLTTLRRDHDGGWSAELGSARLGADVVVNAAGTGAGLIAELAGSPLAMAPSRGLLLDLGVAGTPVRQVLHSPQVSIRPNGPGRLVIRSGQVDRRLSDDVAPDRLQRDLLDRACSVLPALATAATVIGRRIGTRVVPRDGYPSVGALTGTPSYYEAVTHSGVILAPLLARLLATEIHTGRIDPLVAGYRPDRLRP